MALDGDDGAVCKVNIAVVSVDGIPWMKVFKHVGGVGHMMGGATVDDESQFRR